MTTTPVTAAFCNKRVQLPLREKLDDRANFFVPEWDSLYNPDVRPDDPRHFGLVDKLALAVDLDQPAMLCGPTGAGKTSSVLYLASALGQPVRTINLHGDIRAVDLLGSMQLIPGADGKSETVFVDGVLPDAMRNGYWILLDEIDACPAPLVFVLQSVLQPGHRLVLAGNSGEVIDPHPNFRMFSTGNTLGRGDLSGLYAGTNVLNEAFLDRWMVIDVDYMPQAEEVKILTARAKGLPKDTAEKMVQVAHDTRGAFTRNDATVSATFSTRRLIAWAQLAARITVNFTVDANLGLTWAYNLAVGSKLGPEDREWFAGSVQRIMDIDVRVSR